MSQTSKTILILVVLAALVVVIALATGGGGTEVTNEEEEIIEEESEMAVVSYTQNGFEPSTITIEAGETVQWVNDGGTDMWVASAVHPTHEALPGFDQLSGGDTYSYTFEEEGEWRYHNHLNAEDTGTIIVE